MNSNNYNQKSIRGKANYFLKKFIMDYNSQNHSKVDNCIENKMLLTKLKYIRMIDSEKVRDEFSKMCDNYLLNTR